MDTDEELRRIARKSAEKKVGFYAHFAIYVVVNLFLIAIWYFTGDGFPGSSSRFSDGGSRWPCIL